jgi:hypothetical protein
MENKNAREHFDPLMTLDPFLEYYDNSGGALITGLVGPKKKNYKRNYSNTTHMVG